MPNKSAPDKQPKVNISKDKIIVEPLTLYSGLVAIEPAQKTKRLQPKS
jgi:hypothetical protein